MNEMKCKRCGANENRIHGFCSMECETAWEYEDDIRDLTARIAELEEKQRWIPVSERLPEVGKVVHVISMNYIEYFTKTELVYETAVLVEINGVKMFGFVNENSVWSSGDVTHWMYAVPLPEATE